MNPIPDYFKVTPFLNSMELSEDCLFTISPTSEIIKPMKNTDNIPTISRIIYNLKTTESVALRDADGNLIIDPETEKPKREDRRLENPVLATTAYFTDGTKSTVKNTLTDKIQVETAYIDNETGIKVSAGKLDASKSYTEVIVATDTAKEIGLVYAVLKRIYGVLDEKNTAKGNGFGRDIRDAVNAAYDQDLEAAKTKILHKISVANHKAKQDAAKDKKPRRSLAETVDRLAAVLDRLDATTANA